VGIDATTLLLVAVLIVSVVIHEVAHGLVADRLGDDTARRAGRLTLNPIRHLDPFGSVVLPLLGALGGVPFGYAKPVPVRPSRLRSPRRDLVLVALAGPASNLVLCTIGAIVARATLPRGRFVDEWQDLPALTQIGFGFALVNLFLAILNILPIPPLDGSRMVEYFLPAKRLSSWNRLAPYGFVVVFVLVLSGALDVLYRPAIDAILDFIE
jgi:Zn-dependent protease